MIVYKCKMCGGDLKVVEGATICECEYCGSRQTLPKISSGTDGQANLFNMANHYRRQNDFDQAIMTYRKILERDDTNAEAYWGTVLSRYGIEYVEDPTSHERIPTCHRVQPTSILADADYLAALKYAPNNASRELYEREARRISEIQKGILAISEKEKPYDVFICYKETDDEGRRTPDSALAQEIYYELTKVGYKVFFSRITLEDKLGKAYEPYIFAAINSAKVMLVIGTRKEYFNAVWTKNEWSRFLALMREDHSKLLIPCYRGMDPYDIPEELSTLQSQDMSRIGFMQDIIRGIKKVLDDEPASDESEQKAPSAQSAGNIAAQLKRGNMALEDSAWKEADIFFNRALDMDAECARAYLGRFLASKQAPTLEQYIQALLSQTQRVEPIWREAVPEDTARINAAQRRWGAQWDESMRGLYSFNRSYASEQSARQQQRERILDEFYGDRFIRRVNQYADAQLQSELDATLKTLKDTLNARIEQAGAEDAQKAERIKVAYAQHLDEADAQLARQFREAEERARQQREEEDRMLRDDYRMARRMQRTAKIAQEFREAESLFRQLNGYKDSKKRANACQKQAYKLERRSNGSGAPKKKRHIFRNIIIIAVLLYVFTVGIPSLFYNFGESLLDAGEYQHAISLFRLAGDYDNAPVRMSQAKRMLEQSEHYAKGEELIAAGDVDGAIEEFEDAGEYSDARERLDQIHYDRADALLTKGDIDGAIKDLEAAGDYSDAKERLNQVHYDRADALLTKGDIDGAIKDLEAAGDYSDARERLNKIHYDRADALLTKGDIDGAIEEFEAAGDYSDAVDRLGAIHYDRAEALLTKGNIDGAIEEFEAAGDYSDAVERKQLLCYDRAKVFEVAGQPMKAALDYGRAGNYSDALERSRALWEKSSNQQTIAAGFEHSVALMSNGTVVAVGDNYSKQCNVSNWTDVVSVAAGYQNTLGLKSDGTVMAGGRNYDHECDVSDWSNIVAIATSKGYAGAHSLGLKSDGTVVAVGSNYSDQCNVSDWTDIIAIAAGDSHSVGLRSDGTVVAVGDRTFESCDVSGWTDIIAIAAGELHTVGLKSNGRVVATGWDIQGSCEVSGWTDIVAIAAGSDHTVGLKSDGTVVAVGENGDGQCDVSDWRDIVAIAAGGRHTLGLKSNGKVVAVGENNDGQCDVEDWKKIRKPDQH